MKHNKWVLFVGFVLAFIAPFSNEVYAVQRHGTRAESQQSPPTQPGVDACLLKSSILQPEMRVINQSTANYDLKYVRLELDTDPDVAQISGTVTSHFEAVGDIDEVIFELASNMTVSQVTQRGVALNFMNNGNDELVIDLPSIQNSGVLDSLSVTYSGNPIASGFGSFAQTTHNNAGIIWTLSEPYGAKAWWPCKQDLNDKIDVTEVILNTPAGNTGVSNGLLISETSTTTGKRYRWMHNYPIPAYLIAIAVTNYVKYTDTVGSGATALPIDNYVYPEDLVTAQASTAVTVPIMNFFESSFGPYPFRNEKYGHAQFGWGGGMEHTTISFMGGFSRGLIAHELGHQWFGNKVTCGSWQDIWLNESFATYLTGMTVEHLDGAATFKNWRVNANNRATTPTSGSVYVAAQDTLNVGRVFNGNLSYNKGAMVLHMLRKKIGETNFNQTLRNYLDDPQLAFDYAVTTDFKAIAESTSGENLTEFFNDWIYGEGYPEHQIEWRQEPNGVNIIYQQFTSHPSVNLFEVQLPIKITGINGQEQRFMLAIDNNNENFNVSIPFIAATIEIDPDVETISKNNNTTLGTSDAFAKAEFQIAPNPARDYFQITTSNIEVNQVKIFDLNGRIIKNYKSELQNNPDHILPTPEMGGIYLIQLSTNMGIFTEKLIVL
ncbi:putative secreted protein (Por secretion system target) [Nonlabens dokdonensis]|uniref:Aminopeptidase N n=2 Tax=Nonlabens dokdonensis TaxID=328515 RepID=L7W4A1_NONDD|nr:M1 family aminopeptidase [Nonlabens dokdonensis]AGC76420.1 peptidase M1, membrane alanine aminopeptidase [Nonlabens dokdonensis DSW-6]PZX44078.1 putative secreted protein (Por secretion system target) [Nonlabens dokdonensis]